METFSYYIGNREVKAEMDSTDVLYYWKHCRQESILLPLNSWSAGRDRQHHARAPSLTTLHREGSGGVNYGKVPVPDVHYSRRESLINPGGAESRLLVTKNYYSLYLAITAICLINLLPFHLSYDHQLPPLASFCLLPPRLAFSWLHFIALQYFLKTLVAFFHSLSHS